MNLFPGYHIPPLIMLYFTSQERKEGKYSLSPHKLELPGGRTLAGKPRMKSIEFLINGLRADRYYTSHQDTTEQGLLNHYYLELFKNTNCYYSNNGLDITLSEFENYFPLFTFNTCASGRHDPNTVSKAKLIECDS